MNVEERGTVNIRAVGRRREDGGGPRVPTLTALEGPEIGAFYVFPEGKASHLVGRSVRTDFRIESPSVSRQHAEFVVVPRDGECTVEVYDRVSTNGVLVNGLQCTHMRIHSGDKVRIGDALLRFEWMTPDEVRYHTEVNDKLRKATRDQLTGLLTRAFLENRIEELLRQADELRRTVCCLLLDLDFFKRINDTHGHLVGDAVLRRTADALRQGLRCTDFAIRYGGEEMLLLLPGTSLNEASAVATRLRCAIASIPTSDLASDMQVTASFGVAQRHDGESMKAWIERADRALYQAKEAGRNQVVVSREELAGSESERVTVCFGMTRPVTPGGGPWESKPVDAGEQRRSVDATDAALREKGDLTVRRGRSA